MGRKTGSPRNAVGCNSPHGAGSRSQLEASTALTGTHAGVTGAVFPLRAGGATVQLGCPVVCPKKGRIGWRFRGLLFPGEFLQSDRSVTLLDFTQCLLEWVCRLLYPIRTFQ